MQHRGGGAVARLDQDGQGSLTGGGRRLGVGQVTAEKGPARLIAGERIELVHQGDEVRARVGAKGLRPGRPFGGRDERPTLPNACDEPLEQALPRG